MADAVLKLAYEVSRVTEEKVGLIDGVMRRTGVLALNARLEAARAGDGGSAFAIVAQEMSSVAGDIRGIVSELREAVATNIDMLKRAGSEMQFEFRGERLADLARNAVEIIDRNLYERSCDVRWWATDAAMLEALAAPGPETAARAQERLATILRSYTVYLDLWIADANGKVVAHGRPDIYRGVIGTDVSQMEWFNRGMAAQSGDDFAVCDITHEPASRRRGCRQLLDRDPRRRAERRRTDRRDGHFLRLGTPGSRDRRGRRAFRRGARDVPVMLLGADHRVLAASDRRGLLSERFRLDTEGRERGWYREGNRIVAFARTPGYETYRGLGWYGCIEFRD